MTFERLINALVTLVCIICILTSVLALLVGMAVGQIP